MVRVKRETGHGTGVQIPRMAVVACLEIQLSEAETGDPQSKLVRLALSLSGRVIKIDSLHQPQAFTCTYTCAPTHANIHTHTHAHHKHRPENGIRKGGKK